MSEVKNEVKVRDVSELKVATAMGELTRFNHNKHIDYRKFADIYFEVIGCRLKNGLNEFKYVSPDSYGKKIFLQEHLLTVNILYSDIKGSFRDSMTEKGIIPVMSGGYMYPADDIETFILEYFEGVEESVSGSSENFLYKHSEYVMKRREAEAG
jgi:hypothetical protein